MPELRAEHIRVLKSLIEVMSRRVERARREGREEEAQDLERQIRAREVEIEFLDTQQKL